MDDEKFKLLTALRIFSSDYDEDVQPGSGVRTINHLRFGAAFETSTGCSFRLIERVAGIFVREWGF
jgi:hypothetical protein